MGELKELKDVSLLGSRLLVLPIVEEKKTTTGIILSQKEDRDIKHAKGKVIKLSPKIIKKQEEQGYNFLEIDDVVLYPKFCVKDRMTINNEEYVILKKSDILGVV